jgi:hypothetical protein
MTPPPSLRRSVVASTGHVKEEGDDNVCGADGQALLPPRKQIIGGLREQEVAAVTAEV